MKKLLLLAISAFLAGNVAKAESEPADWYFTTTYSWTCSESNQFKTTDTEGVYKLENFTCSGNFNFAVTNSAWSEMYGWKETVNATDKAFGVAATTSGNGWAELPAATYDIVFNHNELTLMFTLSAEQGEIDEGNFWYITGSYNNWGLDEAFVQDETNSDLFVGKFEITEADVTEGYWDFEITSAGWSNQYVCEENVDETDKEYQFVTRENNALSYSHLPAATYLAVWNKKAHTLKFVTFDPAAVEVIPTDMENSNPEYYNLSGQKVSAETLAPGIYIKKQGKNIEKVVLR